MPTQKVPDLSGSYAASVLRGHRDDELSAVRLLSQFYPDGAVHRACSTVLTGRAAASFAKGQRTYCKTCDCKFMPTQGTILEETKLSFWQIETMFILLDLHVDPRIIAGIIEVTIDTVRTWQTRIQLAQEAA